MSSANYIPLTQISPSEFTWHPKAAQHTSFRSYFTRKRAIIALVAATSLVTLLVFLRHSNSQDDDDDDSFWPINWAYQPSYIAIPVPDTLPPAARPKLRPVRDLPSACLEQYYASGLPCHDGRGPVPMDILWTWVNGSDPLFVDARQRAAESYGEDDPNRPKKSNNPSRMFRFVSHSLACYYRRSQHVFAATMTNSDTPSVPSSPTSARILRASTSSPRILTIQRSS